MNDRALNPSAGSIQTRRRPAQQLVQMGHLDDDRARVLEAIDTLVCNTDIAVSVSTVHAAYDCHYTPNIISL